MAARHATFALSRQRRARGGGPCRLVFLLDLRSSLLRIDQVCHEPAASVEPGRAVFVPWPWGEHRSKRRPAARVLLRV